MRKVDFQITYTKEGDTWLALEPLTGTTTEGDSFEEVKEMIKDALELYFSDEDDIPGSGDALTGTVQIQVGC